MTLPPQVHLAPHRSVLPRGARSRQLGLDPDRAVTVDGLDPPLARMLDELTDPVDPAVLVDRAVRRGADAGAAVDTLARLLEIGALVDAGPARRRCGRRWAATVLVNGDGPLAAGVVAGLVHGGVGTVHVESAGTVCAADLGTGLLDGDRGAGRAAAITASARALVPGADVGAPPLRLVPDLVVLADAQVPDPDLVAHCVTTGVAHLPVRLRDGIGVVGPLVLPGRTACLHCLDLHRTALDPGWPGVAAQLVARPGPGDPAAVAGTAALGTAQALAALDGADAPPILDATLELDVTSGSLRRVDWTAHPECPCGGTRHPRATCGAPRSGGTLVR